MKCNNNCKPCRSGMTEGEKQKADALALLEARRKVYVRRGRRALLSAMLAGDGTASADDVYAAVELSPGIDPRCLGSVPGRLAYDHIIRPAGFIRSARPERHASYIQVWELADHAAAERWLLDHPDLPDPIEESEGIDRQGTLFDTQETATPTADTIGAA
jgi:hypothetical protein